MARAKREARIRAITKVMLAQPDLPPEVQRSTYISIISEIVQEIVKCWSARNAEKAKEKMQKARAAFQEDGVVPARVVRALKRSNQYDADVQRRWYEKALGVTETHEDDIAPLLVKGPVPDFDD